MSSPRKRRPEASDQPICLDCESRMRLVFTEPRCIYEYHFERRTFECEKCGRRHTYTMGATRTA